MEVFGGDGRRCFLSTARRSGRRAGTELSGPERGSMLRPAHRHRTIAPGAPRGEAH